MEAETSGSAPAIHFGSFGCWYLICGVPAEFTSCPESPNLPALSKPPKPASWQPGTAFLCSVCVFQQRSRVLGGQVRSREELLASASACFSGRRGCAANPASPLSPPSHRLAELGIPSRGRARGRERSSCEMPEWLKLGGRESCKKLNGREASPPPPPPQIQPIFFPLLLFLISGTMRQSKAWGEERG